MHVKSGKKMLGNRAGRSISFKSKIYPIYQANADGQVTIPVFFDL